MVTRKMFDSHIEEDFNSLYHRLEEALSEADHRCLGGFRTEDQRFALSQRELIRETLDMLTRLDVMVDEIISNDRDEDRKIRDLECALDKIADIAESVSERGYY